MGNSTMHSGPGGKNQKPKSQNYFDTNKLRDENFVRRDASQLKDTFDGRLL